MKHFIQKMAKASVSSASPRKQGGSPQLQDAMKNLSKQALEHERIVKRVAEKISNGARVGKGRFSI